MPVRLEVFDATGARIRSQRTADLGPRAVLRWDGKDDGGARLPAGGYFYRIEAGEERHTGRVTVIR
jgi:hypothetical protein